MNRPTRSTLFGCVLYLILAGTAKAQQFYSGNDLFSQCRTNKEFVIGYVAGAFDSREGPQLAMFSLYIDFLTTAGINTSDEVKMKPFMKKLNENTALLGNVCVPKGVKLGQMTDVFCQFLRDGPAQRHLEASLLFRKAIVAAWPCQK